MAEDSDRLAALLAPPAAALAQAQHGTLAPRQEPTGTLAEPGLGYIWRRIPTTCNPQVACVHVLGVVEAQGSDSGATDGGNTDDVGVVSAESEVFLPGVRARMKEGDFHTRFGVNSGDAGGLVQVAVGTTQGEVVFDSLTSSRARHDMLNVECGDGSHQGERGAAVFTAALRACNDAVAPLSRDISVHDRGFAPVSTPRRCNSRSALAFSRVRTLYSLTNACNSSASASVNVPSLFLACSSAKRSWTSNGKQYAAAAQSSWKGMVADGTVPDIVQFLWRHCVGAGKGLTALRRRSRASVATFLSETGLVTACMIPLKAWCVKHPIVCPLLTQAYLLSPIGLYSLQGGHNPVMPLVARRQRHTELERGFRQKRIDAVQLTTQVLRCVILMVQNSAKMSIARCRRAVP